MGKRKATHQIGGYFDNEIAIRFRECLEFERKRTGYQINKTEMLETMINFWHSANVIKELQLKIAVKKTTTNGK